MLKKLTKHGNSKAIIIDNALLKVLNINFETQLKISIKGKSIIITPIHEDAPSEINDSEMIQSAVEKIMKKYAPALKKLAKN